MQKSIQQNPVSETQFFSEQNEQNLFNVLTQDIQQRQGSGLTRQQTNRLGRTLEHYMQEVWDVNGPSPLNQLNREALTATTNDFLSYLRRNEIAPNLQISEKIVGDTSNQPRIEIAQQRLLSQQAGTVPPRPTFEPALLMDTGSRFEKLQQDRIPPSQMRPAVPNFQLTLGTSADEPSAVSLYEQAKKIREQEVAKVQQEAQRAAGVSNGTGNTPTDVNPLVRFMSPPSIQNDPQNNPTLAQPIVTLSPTARGPLQQDYLIKQDDIINYKEIEYNLVVYSADRDWMANTGENRYRFSVLFDPGNVGRKTFNPQPFSTKKFKNISRIELVKAILPSEGLDVLVQSQAGPVFNTNSKINVLQYPYILVYIPELDTNNYGTDDNIDNSFGILQYDANWYPDTTNLSDGYLGMIPKFMKCQKVYSPTPLATLNKLTIEFQTPDGSPLTNTPDTLVIASITFGNNPLYGYGGPYSNATGGLPYYYLIETTTYFSKWLFQPGNRIQIKGINENTINGGQTMATGQFKKYIEQDEGLLIVGLAHFDTPITPTNILDGTNDMGYANVIIVQAPMEDPTTGSITPLALGGTNTTNTQLGNAILATTFSGVKLINLTHQTNLVLRIITRELDPAARVRPDNL
jgi:hypothetical protein